MQIKKRGVRLEVKVDNGAIWLPLLALLNSGIHIPMLKKRQFSYLAMIVGLLGHKTEIARNRGNFQGVDRHFALELMERTINLYECNQALKRGKYDDDIMYAFLFDTFEQLDLPLFTDLLVGKVDFNEAVERLKHDATATSKKYERLARIVRKATPMLVTKHIDKNKKIYRIEAKKVLKEFNRKIAYAKTKSHIRSISKSLIKSGKYSELMVKVIDGEVVQQMEASPTKKLLPRFVIDGEVVHEKYKALVVSKAVRIANVQANNTNSIVVHGNLLPQVHRTSIYNGYMWLTKRDDKVRPAHKKMDGKRISYGYPRQAKNGFDKGYMSTIYKRIVHPGEEPNCRCVSIPILLKKTKRGL